MVPSMDTCMMYNLCFIKGIPLSYWFVPPSERVKDTVREEDRLLLLLSSFRDYHKDSELTLIQQDCHSS